MGGAWVNQINRYMPVFSLVIAWLFVVGSLYFEPYFERDLFSRSGSIMVLFAGMSEYSLLRMRDTYHGNQLKRYSAGDLVNLKDIHPSKGHQYQETAAHITVVFGTIIWGYGDFIYL